MSTQNHTKSEKGSRVVLWTIPRASSTVFARSMSRIPDVEIWVEPYGYAHIAQLNAKMEEGVVLPTDYKGNENIYQRVAEHVGAVMGRRFAPQTLSYSTIKNSLEGTTAKHVFVKDMAYGMFGDDVTQYIPRGFRHSFLIRHPVLLFSALHKAYYNQFKMINRLLPEEKDEATFDVRNHNDLGSPVDYYETLRDLWVYIRKEVDPKVVVVDSTDLLANPSGVLPRYCEGVGLPFTDSLLSWNRDIEEGASWNWAGDRAGQASPEIFQGSLLLCTCFNPPKAHPPRDQLTDDVIELSNAAMPFYDEMYRHGLRSDE